MSMILDSFLVPRPCAWGLVEVLGFSTHPVNSLRACMWVLGLVEVAMVRGLGELTRLVGETGEN